MELSPRRGIYRSSETLSLKRESSSCVKCYGNYKFYCPTSRCFFQTDNKRFLEEVEFKKEENIRNVIFDKEYFTKNDQVLLLIIVHDTTSVIE
ncbi:hypothetical protein Lal_00042666 [Lupinus albus]|nr:hypothetical protein Lal_00042666 [Lupinus albus]